MASSKLEGGQPCTRSPWTPWTPFEQISPKIAYHSRIIEHILVHLICMPSVLRIAYVCQLTVVSQSQVICMELLAYF